MEDKLHEIKRKLYNEILENESEKSLGLDYLTTSDIQWLIEQVENQQEIIKEKERILKLISLPEKKVIIQTPPLPESDVIRMLQNQIQSLQQDINRCHNKTFTR